MSYYVYVIRSVNSDYTYTGMTNNIERRLKEHNLGKTKSNKKYVPFKLIYLEEVENSLEEVENSLEARKRELYLKGGNGKKRLKNKLEKVDVIVRAGMMELVDMLGLEPSALRCAGSSPVPGKYTKTTQSRVIFCFTKILSQNRLNTFYFAQW